jgi:molecular chaperone DnaJ
MRPSSGPTVRLRRQPLVGVQDAQHGDLVTGLELGAPDAVLPALNGGARGDLVIHIDVRTPSRLTRERRKLMEQLRETLPVDNAPAEKGLFDKVRDYFA